MNSIPTTQRLVGLVSCLRPRAQEAVLHSAELHSTEILKRLLERAKREGPDGEVIRTEFDLIVLESLLQLRGESHVDG